jgi:hypothetical protein
MSSPALCNACTSLSMRRAAFDLMADRCACRVLRLRPLLQEHDLYHTDGTYGRVLAVRSVGGSGDVEYELAVGKSGSQTQKHVPPESLLAVHDERHLAAGADEFAHAAKRSNATDVAAADAAPPPPPPPSHLVSAEAEATAAFHDALRDFEASHPAKLKAALTGAQEVAAPLRAADAAHQLRCAASLHAPAKHMSRLLGTAFDLLKGASKGGGAIGGAGSGYIERLALDDDERVRWRHLTTLAGTLISLVSQYMCCTAGHACAQAAAVRSVRGCLEVTEAVQSRAQRVLGQLLTAGEPSTRAKHLETIDDLIGPTPVPPPTALPPRIYHPRVYHPMTDPYMPFRPTNRLPCLAGAQLASRVGEDALGI